MVYLSSRAIGQSHTTKQYLKSIAQDSKQLPDGPVLLSPTSILTAFRRYEQLISRNEVMHFYREVIERRPEEFKIAALNDLKQLFPHNPFYAGFGNRETVGCLFFWFFFYYMKYKIFNFNLRKESYLKISSNLLLSCFLSNPKSSKFIRSNSTCYFSMICCVLTIWQ